MSYANSSNCETRVLMMPDYRQHNPYQTLLADSLGLCGVRVIFFNEYKRVFPIFRAMRATSAKVLHLHWLTPYLRGRHVFSKTFNCIKFLLDIVLVKLGGGKIVWTVHNYNTHDDGFVGIEMWTQSRLMRVVDRILYFDKWARDNFSDTGQSYLKKSVVIPHGHYRTAYGGTVDSLYARRALGLPERGRIFLNLGLLRPYKGLEDLISVWRDNYKSFEGQYLLIAGEAFDKDYQQKLLNQMRGVAGILFRPEFVEYGQVHLYLSAADVVLMPFRKILTSGSLILAMSYGKPVIAPRMGGVLEYLGDAEQLTYRSDDNDGLLKAIKKSMTVDLEAMSRVVQKMCDRLGWDGIGKQTKKAYGLD